MIIVKSHGPLLSKYKILFMFRIFGHQNTVTDDAEFDTKEMTQKYLDESIHDLVLESLGIVLRHFRELHSGDKANVEKQRNTENLIDINKDLNTLTLSMDEVMDKVIATEGMLLALIEPKESDTHKQTSVRVAEIMKVCKQYKNNFYELK